MMRGHLGAVRRILTDLVAQRAHRDAENAGRTGAVAVATRERLQDKFAFDFLDCGADQQRDHLVRVPRLGASGNSSDARTCISWVIETS